ncbi:hypothetical protein HanHA89_Chr10g0385891 [Helianthus annuus]|nr:hypothetical protein HanHA89_Chr10g0385891 [Helianthus annuus]
MAEQFRQTFHGGDDGVPQFDIKQQYFSTTEQQFMQIPQLMKMAKSLGSINVSDESLSNPAQKEQLEEQMARIKEDPSLKPILEEIGSGGPTAMMSHGSEDATASAGHPVADGRKKLQRLDKEAKAIKAELMSNQEKLQLVEEHVKATKAILMSLLEERHQHGKMIEALKADLMSLLEQHQHDERIEALVHCVLEKCHF